MINILRIDHVAIAVRDYKKAKEFFSNILGAVCGSSAEIPGTKYFWQNMSLGDLSRLELLKPTGEGSFLDNFLKDKEGGVHHITLQTPNIYKAEEALKEACIPYFGRYDYPVGYWKELFIHPRDAFGVLIQIAEFEPEEWLSENVRMNSNKKYEVEKTENGCILKFSHPGGGTVEISLSEKEILDLSAQLKKI